MKVLISGISGLIGEALKQELTDSGHVVFGLSRKPSGDHIIHWDPKNGQLSDSILEETSFDAVVHLAGENIASQRWTEEVKQRIRSSRIQGTNLLVETICKLDKKPSVFLSASAIGFYGHRGDESLSEESTKGSGFLADLCSEWEEACARLGAQGTRVVNARIGVVLSTDGGALAKMLTPFKLGLGGPIGSGKQYMSWITLKDVVKAMVYLIEHNHIDGPVNLVSPHPVTNAQFTSALGHAIGRPTLFPMPAFAARLAFGEMADELLLSSTRVNPEVLKKCDFEFSASNINEALKQVLSS